jgi:two-component system phosphate regulon response regulator PhoB
MAKEHLLVVEDEEDILELLRYNLAKEGYRVTGVIEGKEGLRAASSDPSVFLIPTMVPDIFNV